MKYFEYTSPDSRVLFNPENNTYGAKFLTQLPVTLYLIDIELAKTIRAYSEAEDKSQFPMVMAEDDSYIDLANIKDYLSNNYSNTFSEISIEQKDTNDLVK